MGLLLLQGDSDFRGALDSLGTGLESAWSSARKLRAAYSGPVIRVRRSSDNAEQDFSGSGSLGAVSVAAIESFCGAGNGFLTALYDQSGNGRNLVQATTTIQPQIVTSGVAATLNGRLTPIYSAASPKALQVASSTSTYGFLHGIGTSTVFWLLSVNDTAANKVFARNSNFAGNQNGLVWLFTSTEGLYVQAFSNNNQTPALRNPAAGTGAQSWTTLLDLTNSTLANRMTLWRNKTLQSGSPNTSSGTAAASAADQNYTIGADWGFGNGFDGWIGEHYIWSQDRTADRATFEDSAHSFWGI